MMKRLVLAGLMGGLTVLLWSVVSWGVIPWHVGVIREIPDGEAVVQAMSERVERTGVYFYPGFDRYGGSWERFQRGPNLNFVAYSTEGENPRGLGPIARGLLLNIISALVAASLLLVAIPRLPRLGHQALFVTLVASFAAVQTHLIGWNWLQLPLGYTLVAAFDLVIAWFLAGLVIGRVLAPGQPAS